MAKSALLSSNNAVDSRHLTASELAGYVDHALKEDARRRAEEHLEQCPECRDEATAIMNAADSYETGRQDLETHPRAVRRSSWSRTALRRVMVGVGAVAAGLVGVLVVRQPNGPNERTAGVRAPQTLSSERETAIAGAVPADGATIPSRGAVFRWRRAAADAYRFTLLKENGQPLWSREITDTTVTLPATVSLDPGRTYFWRVDAMADGITATSGAQRLQVAP